MRLLRQPLDGLVPGHDLPGEEGLGVEQSGGGRPFHLVDQALPAEGGGPHRLEVAGLGDVRVGQTRAGVPGMVGRQLAPGLHDEVVQVGGDAERPADRVRRRRLGLVDHPEDREHGGIEEAQRPGQPVELVVDRHLGALEGAEPLDSGDDMEVAGAGGHDGERLPEERHAALHRRRLRRGLGQVGAVHGAHVVGHGLAHLLGGAHRRTVLFSH